MRSDGAWPLPSILWQAVATGRRVGASSVLLGLLWVAAAGSAWLRLSLPLWPAVAARGEEERAPSGTALEVAVSRVLLGRVLLVTVRLM
jgi:hypothetical protein